MYSGFVGKKILFAPLNWGLGHAARSVSIIEKLLKLGAQVYIAGDGASYQFLREIFPQLPSSELPSYNIEYPTGIGGAWKTVFKAPHIIRTIHDEQKVVEDLVHELELDFIFSDNRYGVYSHQIPSIFIGHQLRVLPPRGLQWGSGVILTWHKKYLKNFTEVWVPDFAGEDNLSGVLSHDVNVGVPIRYIGPQSRFSQYGKLNGTTENNEVIALLSGPEPQRTLLENILLSELSKLPEPSTLIRGVVEDGEERTIQGVQVVNYLHGEDLFQRLQSARVIICRSGYSTLMDLSYLGKKVILIPTPGQTEQEYLAKSLHQRGQAILMKQSKFDLKKALYQLESTTPLSPIFSEEDLLTEALLSLLQFR